MSKLITATIISFITLYNVSFAQKNNISFVPIQHATFVIKTEKLTILVDPGRMDFEKYKEVQNPDLILITHDHGDHLDVDIVNKLKGEKTVVIGPAKVTEKIGYGQTISNNEITTFGKVLIETIPMYNTTPERQRYHKKGDGNGYILTLNKERIYIAGDTEDISEMHTLQNIDHAFVCMNLPYTMTPEQAASAVLEFKPGKVYPYHYRTTGKEITEIPETFRKLVAADKKIEVQLLQWY